MRYNFTEEFKKQLKDSFDIVEFAGNYFDVRPHADLYKAKCIHNGGDEQKPSLTFYPDTQSFYCYGCHAGLKEGSDIIGFYQWIENVDYQTAVIALAEKAGIPLPKVEMTAAEKKLDSLYKQIDAKNKEYYHNLSKHKETKDYFLSRGITKDELIKWRLGATLFTDINEYVPCYGLIDEYNRTVAFSWRVDSEEAKYKNSKESPIFKKKNLLYGFNYAKPMIRKNRHAVIVEGYHDVISLQRYGIPAVGIMCTRISTSQAELLKKVTDNVIVFLDGDNPGISATMETIKRLSKLGFEVEAINIAGFDPDDFAKKRKEETYQYILDNKTLGYEFIINIILSKYRDSSIKLKKESIKSVKEVINGIEDLEERAIYSNVIDKIIKE